MRVSCVEGFDVVIAVSARDIDGDLITTTVEWGDGTSDRGRGVIFAHSYNDSEFQDFTIRITAQDSRGGVTSTELEVEITPPEIIELDLAGIVWERVTQTDGLFDGVPTFSIDAAGTLFAHNYQDIIRRSVDEGENWQSVLEDVECCGEVIARRRGEVFVASPGGLFFSGDNGNTWVLWNESKYLGAALSGDGNYLVAATANELQRFDMTGRMEDAHPLPGVFEDVERCAGGVRGAFSTQNGHLWINDRPDLHPDGWILPGPRFAKAGDVPTSVSFDEACHLYQGQWNGYRVLRTTGHVTPQSDRPPEHLIHIAGSHANNLYAGTGYIRDVMPFANSAVLVGTDRGIWGNNEPRNAHRAPYWPELNRGLDRSREVRQFGLHPGSGHLYVSTSAAQTSPRYCRRRVRRNRRNRRSRVNARGNNANFVYVYCGMTSHYYGGLFRSIDPLLESRSVGDGGAAFDPRYARGTTFDAQSGGMVVAIDPEQSTDLWLVNTAESNVTRWDPSTTPPEPMGTYRVGLPAGECPDTCCWADGCNMPSRVALDGHGDVYVASQGFQFQGTVTKIAADQTDCIDRNNNGRIDTSTDRSPMDYGEDECVLWTRAVGPPNAVLRALTVDVGDGQRPGGYVWVGGFNTHLMYKLDPTDGTVIDTVPTELEPYGAVVAGDGTLYVSALGSGDLEAIDSRQGRVVQRVANPAELRDGCRGSYGITLDRQGRIWTNGWDCPDAVAYDLRRSWCRVTIPGHDTIGRGIAGTPQAECGRPLAEMVKATLHGGTKICAYQVNPTRCQLFKLREPPVWSGDPPPLGVTVAARSGSHIMTVQR